MYIEGSSSPHYFNVPWTRLTVVTGGLAALAFTMSACGPGGSADIHSNPVVNISPNTTPSPEPTPSALPTPAVALPSPTSTRPYKGNASLLHMGDSGSAVTTAQLELKVVGCDVGPIDGAFELRTETATKTYQANEHLPRTGNIGPLTQKALRHSIQIGEKACGAPVPSPSPAATTPAPSASPTLKPPSSPTARPTATPHECPLISGTPSAGGGCASPPYPCGENPGVGKKHPMDIACANPTKPSTGSNPVTSLRPQAGR